MIFLTKYINIYKYIYIKIKLELYKMLKWINCILVVRFDIDEGQVIEYISEGDFLNEK